MKFNTTAPIYMQIINSIKKEIANGTLACGSRLDSVRVLSEKFEVNLNTMQRACSEMERQGIICTQRGIGSFVTEDEKIIAELKKEMSDELMESFLSGMTGIGYNTDEIYNLIRKVLKK